MHGHNEDAHWQLAPSDVEQHLTQDHHASLDEINQAIASCDPEDLRDWLLNYDTDADTADEQAKREAALSVFHNAWHDTHDDA